MVVACSEVGVDAVARSKARVEAAVCSKDGDEAAVCSRPGIEDGRRRWHDGVYGNRRARESAGLKNRKVW
jgi:hypothetical protein